MRPSPACSKQKKVSAQGALVAALTLLLLGTTGYPGKITLPMTTEQACGYSRSSALICSSGWAAALPDILS